MKILYSVLEHPEAMAKLQASGLSENRVKEILQTAAADASTSPANFKYVGALNAEERKAHAVEGNLARQTNATRLRKLKRFYSVLIRKLNSAESIAGSTGNVRLDAATMVVISQKMKQVEPTKSEGERRELLVKLMGLERDLLVKQSRHPRGYLIKQLSSKNTKEIAPKRRASTKQSSKKTFER